MAFTAAQARDLAALRSALGTPYAYGGTSLKNGVDCSGLVYAALRAAGIRTVPRTSQAQFQHGTPVPMNGLRPGDLVFSNWGSETGGGHVSIYIGGGKIIESASPGTDVSVKSMSVLSGHIVGARRYIANAGQGLPNVSSFAHQQIQHYQQNAGGQPGNPGAAALALSQIHPIQVQPANPLPTALGALQKTIGAGVGIGQPLQPTTPVPAPAPASLGLSSSLNDLHTKLIGTGKL